MIRIALGLAGLGLSAVAALGLAASSTATAADEPGKAALSGTIKDIDGQPLDLAKLHGQVVLVVNTASQCGYTPQYKDLEAIHQEFKDQGFSVLGFPCNDFGGQEPDAEAKIKEFCQTNYKVTFPLTSKVTVKGAQKHPVYEFLTNKATNPASGGEIKWNFTKFLIGRDGKVIARFEPGVKPSDDKVKAAIKEALAQPKA